MTLGQLLNQLRLFNRHRAEDDPIQATGDQLFGALERAHTTTELNRDVEGGGDGPHRCVIDRLTPFGAIEIHQVQTGCPLALPAEGLRHRILTESGHLVVIPLVKPNTGSIEQINGGNDLHRGRTRDPPSCSATLQWLRFSGPSA